MPVEFPKALPQGALRATNVKHWLIIDPSSRQVFILVRQDRCEIPENVGIVRRGYQGDDVNARSVAGMGCPQRTGSTGVSSAASNTSRTVTALQLSFGPPRGTLHPTLPIRFRIVNEPGSSYQLSD